MSKRRRIGFCVLLAAAAVVVCGYGTLWAQAKSAATRPVKITEITPLAPTPETPKRIYPEATRLIDRKGRVVIYEMDVLGEQTYKPWFRSAFVGDTDKDVFILLENRILEKLEKVAGRGRLPVEVTGTLSEYKGRNYLLLSRASVAPE